MGPLAPLGLLAFHNDMSQFLSGIVETESMATTDTAAERGSGNDLADLGMPEADAHLTEAELVSRIDDIVRERRITQAEAARLPGANRLTGV